MPDKLTHSYGPFSKEPRSVQDNITKPKMSRHSTDGIIELASKYASDIRYKFDGQIEKCVRKIGGEIKYTDFWAYHQNHLGSIQVIEKGKFTIWLSSRASTRMNAFTIAHELGHYFVHYVDMVKDLDGKFLVAGRYDDGAVEKQADIFALNFLAPKDVVRRLYESGLDVDQISSQICVDGFLIRKQLGHD